MTWHGQSPRAWRVAWLALPILALTCVLLLAGAAAARAEQLLQFGPLQEDLRSHAIEAFADVGSMTGVILSAEFDLNADGRPELILIQINDTGCIGNTCPVRVLQHQGDGWRVIGSFLASPNMVRVYDGRDFGYRRLGNMPAVDRSHQDGVPTIQVWWPDRYWDLPQLNDEAFTWPGEPLHFRRPTARERRIIATRIWPDNPKKSAEWRRHDVKHDFRVAAVDLNADGEKELILVTTNPGWCGSVGCRGEIVQRLGRRWSVISLISVGALDRARVLRERHNGYRALRFMSVVAWTGEDYREYGDDKDDLDY